jgi:hypothetical protein
MLTTRLRSLTALLFPALLAACATGGSSGASSTEVSPLERSLAATDVEAVAADVTFLSVDELGGRDSPSEGLRIAARYLVARLAPLGWEPGADGSWFHEFELERRGLDVEATALTLRGDGGDDLVLRWGEGVWVHPSGVGDGVVTGGTVWCGAGRPDDLEGLELDGAFAVCRDDDVSWRVRRRAVRAAGGAGLIVLERGDGQPYSVRHAGWTRSAQRGGLALAGVEEDRAFPYLYVGRDAGRALLALAGHDADPAVGTVLGLEVEDARASSAVETVPLENVAALWPGDDPELAGEVVILSAHYDHIGIEEDGDVFNGADDNGSGTSALLAVAEGLAARGPLRRSVMLLWVSAEEKGLLGSEAFARDPVLPEGARAVANLNLDMVGRNAPDSLGITPSAAHEAHNGLSALAEQLAAEEGFVELVPKDAYWSRSDHAMFHEHMGLPVAFLFADVHDDYHQVTDTADKVDFDKVLRVSRLVLRMLDAMDAGGLDPDADWFAPSEGETVEEDAPEASPVVRIEVGFGGGCS